MANSSFETHVEKTIPSPTHLEMRSKCEMLQKLFERFPQYFMDNPLYDDSYVFKSVGNVLVVLQKMDETITNETRDVFDKKFAHYRADKLKVIAFFYKLDIDFYIEEKSVRSVFLTYGVYQANRYTLNYEIGKEVSVTDYDMKLDKVDSTGIHYFKSIEAAYFYEPVSALFKRMFDGVRFVWLENGEFFNKYELSELEETENRIN